MTRFSVLGVTIGVFALVVVLSVMGGFEQNLRKRMFEGVSHIELVSPDNALAGFSITQDFKRILLSISNSLSIGLHLCGLMLSSLKKTAMYYK